MKVFEFYFNPKENPDVIFDSFCYEPTNIYEKRMGSLYLAGVLKNALPQNNRFLENLAGQIKERYYKLTSASPEKSLRESLRKANEFLENIAREGDVSWLGNLSFAAISIKNFGLNFTKVGDLKIFLLRKGQVIDVDQKLKFDDFEPYPLKIFGNIVSGKLSEGDVLLVLTKEVLEIFEGENLLDRIAAILPFNQKKLKEVLKNKQEKLSKISGICLLAVAQKEDMAKERETLSPIKLKEQFSLKQVFLPLVKNLKKIKAPVIKKIAAPKLPQLKKGIPVPKIKALEKIQKLPKFRLKTPQIKLPKITKRITFGTMPLPVSKKIIFVLGLGAILALGFFIFERQEEQQIENYKAQLIQIEEKVNQAEAFLLITETNPQAENDAIILFKEALEDISPLVKISPTLPQDLNNRIFNLNNKITKNLYQLNKLVNIEDPELIFQFDLQEFIPQKLITDDGNLYFFSPYAQNLFQLNKEREGNLLLIDKKINSAAVLTDYLLFFSKPDQVVILKEGSLNNPVFLDHFSDEFNFIDLSVYRSNLYFLDNKNKSIIKYPYQSESQWSFPQLWLDYKESKDFRSLAVDGAVWVLNKENAIEKYYAGTLQETFSPEIFPSPEYLSKIITNWQLPYLYILEPGQKRIIILDKSGKIIKQLQSGKFDNLLDFTVSEDGKTIYLLNGLSVYKITF